MFEPIAWRDLTGAPPPASRQTSSSALFLLQLLSPAKERNFIFFACKRLYQNRKNLLLDEGKSTYLVKGSFKVQQLSKV